MQRSGPDRWSRYAPMVLAVFFGFQAWMSERLMDWVHPRPYSTVKTHTMDPRVSSAVRALAHLTGYKILVGHSFWIHVAQYYGDSDNAADRYAKLYDYCSVASDLNPRLTTIYTFGAATLAFHLKRFEEAVHLLEKGIRANPEDIRLKLLLAAIGFQNAEDYEKFIPFLEAEILRQHAPTMLVNILANTYEKVGRYQDAIRLWRNILNFTDSNVQRIEAAQKLQELYALTRERDP